MKKFESIIYFLSLCILILVMFIKSLGWSWGGAFLIFTFTVLALTIFALSWLIFTIRDENKKRIYFLYGSIPFGYSYATLLIGCMAKLQHWSWAYTGTRSSVLIFLITLIIFIIAYFMTKNQLRKNYLRSMILKCSVFTFISLLVVVINFDIVISAISSNEVNERREIQRKQYENSRFSDSSSSQ